VTGPVASSPPERAAPALWGGNLLEFPRGLGQFQLSFPTEQTCKFRSSGRSQRQDPVTPLVKESWVRPHLLANAVPSPTRNFAASFLLPAESCVGHSQFTKQHIPHVLMNAQSCDHPWCSQLFRFRHEGCLEKIAVEASGDGALACIAVEHDVEDSRHRGEDKA